MAYVALAGAAIQAYGASQQKGGGGAPSRVDSVTDQLFDNSGWNVNTGGNGKITSNREQQPAAAALQGELQSYIPYFVFAVIAVVAWKTLKK